MSQEISNQSGYQFESILLQSERLNREIELKNNVTDVDIYEHIDKPYMTGTMALIDNENVLQNVDIQGGEKITIALRSFRKNSITITNTFYISKISDSPKVNDNAQIIILDLIEDIGYTSNLQVVNRSYRGKISDILRKISFNYLGNKGIKDSKTDVDNIKVIIPNLDPLQSLVWLTRRAKTKEGYPYYLYSSFTSPKLQFHDLGTMLQTPVLNSDIPYRENSAAARSIKPDIKRRTITNHKFSVGSNLLDLIERCLIGSKYEYIDTTLEARNIFHYDVIKDVFKPLIDKSILQRNQNNPPFSPKYKFNEKSFNELDASYKTMIGGSNAFRTTDEDNFIVGYNEEKNLSGYKAKIICKAMDEILRQEPLTMIIDGVDFIDGDKHSTIGNNLRVEFSTSNPEITDASKIDKRKSGDYLIFAAKHMFKKERYDLAVTCVKLGNYKRDIR